MKPRVVVIGAGFAGMAVVRALRDTDADVTLVDRNNHHVFQPFLFQVATAILEPAEIATPIRSFLNDIPNLRVEMGTAVRVDLKRRVVVMADAPDLPYDMLVLATGARTSYFGHESDWPRYALGLKSLSDAVAARNQLLRAFERAELESNRAEKRRQMTVVVVGGGPTGVAITGSISELVRRTLPVDYRNIELRRARVVLVESGPRLLPGFNQQHSAYAKRALEQDGVEVRLGLPVTQVDAGGVVIGKERIEAATVLWCAGVQGVPLARTLEADIAPNGTISVADDLSIPGHPECFVVGDAARVVGPDGRPLPGLASLAQREGRYVGTLIAARLGHTSPPPALDLSLPGKLATITRHVGVAEYGHHSITGFAAWLMWGLLHLSQLSDAHSRRSILADWLRLLMTYRRSSRLIVEPVGDTPPSVRDHENAA